MAKGHALIQSSLRWGPCVTSLQSGAEAGAQVRFWDQGLLFPAILGTTRDWLRMKLRNAARRAPYLDAFFAARCGIPQIPTNLCRGSASMWAPEVRTSVFANYPTRQKKCLNRGKLGDIPVATQGFDQHYAGIELAAQDVNVVSLVGESSRLRVTTWR